MRDSEMEVADVFVCVSEDKSCVGSGMKWEVLFCC